MALTALLDDNTASQPGHWLIPRRNVLVITGIPHEALFMVTLVFLLPLSLPNPSQPLLGPPFVKCCHFKWNHLVQPLNFFVLVVVNSIEIPQESSQVLCVSTADSPHYWTVLWQMEIQGFA